MLKQKLILLLFLCFIFLEKSHAQADSSTVAKTPPSTYKRSLNLFFAPEINYRVLRATSQNKDLVNFKNDIETAAFSYTFGANLVRHIASQVDYEIGLWYSIRNIHTQKIDYLWDDGQLQPAGKIQYFYNYHFLQIPLKLTFYFNKNRNYYIGTGVMLYDSYTDGGSHKAKIWNANGDFEKEIKIETPFYFGKNMGGILLFFGKQWSINDYLRIRIEPMFKLSLQSATDKEYFKTFFYSFGVNMGVDLW